MDFHNDSDYRKELNEQQYKAVVQKDGPILILAGAGSGKTRVITYRISYLINHYHVSPYNILAITFTNKAANEMRERVGNMLGDEGRGVFISTFHRFCGRMLRDYGSLCGFSSSFSVYDEKDCEKVIKEVLHELDIDPKRESPTVMRSRISKLKNEMVDPEYFREIMNKSNPIERTLYSVYKLYQQKLADSNAMDFDDMLLHAARLLDQNPDVLKLYSNRFKYIMIDEYQDTNKVQYHLVSKLAGHGNLCVVGDDDQSIYSFRGADIRNILDFEEQFPDVTVIKLEQNYRSTSHILNAANSIIKGNNSRKSKNLWTNREGGERVKRFVAESQLEESSFTAREIGRLVETGDYCYSDVAILYRQNALSQNFEAALTRAGIPFRVYGGMRFFERAEIKILVNYLRLFLNPNDVNALTAVINIPKRSVGDKGIEAIIRLSQQNSVSPFAIIANASKYPELTRYSAALSGFADTYYELSFELDNNGVADFVQLLLDRMGILEYYEKTDKEKDEDRVLNLKEFITVAREYEEAAREDSELEASLSGFLQNISLSTDMDSDDPDDDKVTLMTVHSCKGLEYPVVFVAAMEEGIFPGSRAIDEGNIDEERRLCYVAVTRAKDRLYLLNSKERMLYGQTKLNFESEFLREIDREDLEFVNYFGERFTPQRSGKGRIFESYPRYGERGDYVTYGGSENYSYGNNSRGYSGRRQDTGNYSGRRQDTGSFDFDPFGDDSGDSGNSGNSGDRSAGKPAYSNSGYGYGKKTGAKRQDLKKAENAASIKYKEAEMSAMSGDKDVKVGDNVIHAKYGEGIVTAIEGNYSPGKDDRICEIHFEKYGMKRFAMQFTKLKKV
ncbi:MAG: UvrD-helicase domain-containing protein [Clostridia bacterium]|nr:UvrD-helicase domain-containing protein [Clostridia bacterium]